MKKTKAFDCVEMKRRIQAKIHEETKGMGYKELAEYYRRRIAQSEFASFFDKPSPESREGGGEPVTAAGNAGEAASSIVVLEEAP